jgi:8-oxo-dGTP pyrophosphatase MutT (NUDIX family)
LGTLATWSSIIGAALAVLAILIGFGVGSVRWQRYYLGCLRWKHIGRVACRLRGDLTRRDFRTAADGHLDRRLLHGGATTLAEWHWLTGLLGAEESDHVEGGYSRTLKVPFSFHVDGHVDASQRQALQAVAQSYREYAIAIRRRWMLRAAAAPLIADEHECVIRVAERIDAYSRSSWLSIPDDALRNLTISTAVDVESGMAQWTRIRAFPQTLGRPTRQFANLRVSSAPYRVVSSPGSIAYKSCPLDVQPLCVQEFGDEPAAGSFDGVMTRLHGDPGYRIEIDPHSGRQVLHLCLSETSFFAFRLTQWKENDPLWQRRHHAFQSRLLSVNLFLIDDEERVLLVQRAHGMTHGSRFAGSVSGAIEPLAREGIAADVDDDGFPAPLKTTIREAREELGISLDEEDSKVSVIGLIEVMTPRDMHTHVLTVTARIGESATTIRPNARLADEIEGSWEVGASALVIDLRAATASRDALRSLVGWMRTSTAMLPHGVGGLVLLLLVRLPHVIDAQHSDRPTTADLIDALRLPTVGDTAPTPSSVNRRAFDP